MNGKLYEFNIFKIGLCSLLNCIANFLYLYALFYLPCTMYQMLLGSIIIFTPFLSKFLLRKQMYLHTYVGIVISVIALILISCSSYMLNFKSEITKNKLILSVIFMLVGLFIQSCQRVYEEKLLKTIETSAFRFIGLEGLFGLLFITVFHTLVLLVYIFNDGF